MVRSKYLHHILDFVCRPAKSKVLTSHPNTFVLYAEDILFMFRRQHLLFLSIVSDLPNLDVHLCALMVLEQLPYCKGTVCGRQIALESCCDFLKLTFVK